jgi:hypothetical protein
VSRGWPVVIPILPVAGISSTAVAAFSDVIVVAAGFLLIVGAASADKRASACRGRAISCLWR